MRKPIPWVFVATILLQIAVSSCKPQVKDGTPLPSGHVPRAIPIRVPLPPPPFRSEMMHPDLMPFQHYKQNLVGLMDNVASLELAKAPGRLQLSKEKLVSDLGMKKKEAEKGGGESLGSTLTSASTSPTDLCPDEDGATFHQPGDVWHPNNDPCYVCQCREGETNCFIVDCMPHSTPVGQTCTPVQNPGECCPQEWICLDLSTTAPAHN